MYIVIVGGGKVGSFLARGFAAKGHAVGLVERRPEAARRLAAELGDGVLVVEGDGCGAGALEDAGIARADVFAAVTGEDDVNLIGCQLARVGYRVRRAVARVNSPRNETIFRALGIEAISSTTVIGLLIEEELGAGDIVQLRALARGRLALVEIDLPHGCAACGRRVAELALPAESVLTSVLRAGRAFVPRGQTRLEGGDKVVAITPVAHKEDLRRALVEGA